MRTSRLYARTLRRSITVLKQASTRGTVVSQACKTSCQQHHCGLVEDSRFAVDLACISQKEVR